jgi:hypothetical protein
VTALAPLAAGAHTVTLEAANPFGYQTYLSTWNVNGLVQPYAVTLNVSVPSAIPVATLANSGQTLVTNTQTLAGLNVSRQVTVPNTGSQDFARTVDYLQNPTSSPITTTVHIFGRLGAGAATRVFATSSGDSVPSPSDEWFGTDGGPGSTAVISIVHGPAGLMPTAEDVVGDTVEWTYGITVQPGQTVELGTFTIQASSEANAIAEANALVTSTGFGGHAADFLSGSDLAALANFQFMQATGTALRSSAPTSVYGQSVTFTATVTAGGNPVTSGSVTFQDGSTVLASNVPLNASGQATFSTSTLTPGPHTLTANYSGSGIFLTSSGTANQTVNQPPTIASASSATFTVGQAGSFTVTTGPDYPTATTLTESGSLPSGVTFTDNGNGTATLAGTPAAGTVGHYTLTITAANGVAPNATQTFTLNNAEAPSLVVTTLADVSNPYDGHTSLREAIA